jgi:AraC-like DNA-binding protein
MLAYFTGREKPAEALLRLKLKELIVSILLGGKNPELAAYFQSLVKTDAPSLSQIMEANFCYNLSLEDFAKLSHRSVSTFKREFRKYYKQPPGKWLQQKRLEYSAVLLKNPAFNVSQVALDCVYHPVWNVVLSVAMPLIMSVYVGVAQKAASPGVTAVLGEMNNDLVAAEVQLKDMLRIANDLDFEAVDQNGHDILARKTNVANAAIRVVTRAMEAVGGEGFYRGFGLERLFRDIQGARYHPLPEHEQVRFSGEYLLRD